MKSRLCILETVKPLKMILDSAMASKMKNIYHKKTSCFFYPEDGFHQKKTSWSLGVTKPFTHEIARNLLYMFNLYNLFFCLFLSKLFWRWSCTGCFFFWPPLNLTKSQALYNLNWPPLKFSKYKDL